MNRSLHMLIFYLCFINTYALDIYVSNQGNDANAGTMDSPVRTVSKAKKLNPDRILLRSGDTFYEPITLDGIDLSAYGSGNAPIVCGLKILKTGAWVQGRVSNAHWHTSNTGNIWRANLSLSNDNYLGYKTYGSSKSNSIGQIVNIDTDDMNNCRRVRYISELSSNFDFWQGLEDYPDSLSSKQVFDYIYLYYEGNPNDLNLGLAIHSNGIQPKNCTISNIKITHWGRHGIAGGSNVTVENCDIDGIGGSYPPGVKPWVLLGNGIEFYMNSPGIENVQVTNCTISRCFDAGLTVQGHNTSNSICGRNISFRHNRLHNCCQSFEFFLRGPDENDLYHNCIVYDNISFSVGINTGFRYYDKRYKRCHILENSLTRRTGIIYSNNLFVNGNYYCSSKSQEGYYDCPIWRDNTCYIVRGQHLMGNYNGNGDVIVVPQTKGTYSSLEEATLHALNQYRKLTKDYTTKFIILDKAEDMERYSFIPYLYP